MFFNRQVLQTYRFYLIHDVLINSAGCPVSFTVHLAFTNPLIMKKFFPLFTVVFLFFTSAKSQFVTLQDQYFSMNLQLQYPSCFNTAGQMDTTCSEIINEDTLFTGAGVTNLDGIQYFKNIRYLLGSQGASPMLTTIPSFPSTLIYISIPIAGPIRQLPALPPNLQYLDCMENPSLASLPALPATLKYLNVSRCQALTGLPSLPEALEYLDISGQGWQGSITSLPNMPASLRYLNCAQQSIDNLPAFAPGLTYIDCHQNFLTSFPDLPPALQHLDCSLNSIPALSALPSAMVYLNCSGNALTAIPSFPAQLDTIICNNNNISVLPSLPASLKILNCGNNRLHSLQAVLPVNLLSLSCNNNPLYSLPATLPAQMESLNCGGDSLSVLPPLPSSLYTVDCSNNQLSSLPALPRMLYDLKCFRNNIYCLPTIPPEAGYIYIDMAKINCTPNRSGQAFANSIFYNEGYESISMPLCDITNNRNNCQSFPVMRGHVFYDLNSNNSKDANEPYKPFAKVSLSNDRYTFTNDEGRYEIGTTDTGSYNLSVNVPARFHTTPAAYNYHFTTFDSIVNNNFALQPDVVFDSLTISLVAESYAARPGFGFVYRVYYENAGTTALSPAIIVNYENTKLDFETAMGAAAVNNGSSLTVTPGSLFPGESKSFYLIFTIKPAIALGDSIQSKIIITGSTANAADSSQVYVSGSFDPNDKQATAQLSPAQVAAGSYIYYTIRFQNTGTDTAFNIVISDTLSNQLQWNTLQLVQSSHTCKTTVNNDKAYFEFRGILLPDSNINEPASHGFVSFRIKPKTNVPVNSTISNIANIFFDYNSPVITNTATTRIQDFSTVPLKLVSFTGMMRSANTTFLQWITSNEINTKIFIVEQSTDGIHFDAVASIQAKGRENNTYSLEVAATVPGNIFYRLKMIDHTGDFSYSPLIYINREKTTAGLIVVTNPVKDFIMINTSDRTLYNTYCNIINSSGTVVKTFPVKEGTQLINVQGLPAGIYYLKTKNGSSRVLFQ
jgi:uncharacterized repeat protein (TIGR01451 family)